MDFKFLEIGTRIAIGQFDATIIEYDVLDGFSGLFPVYVVRFDTGETEPVHHTDITGLIYDNPMPIEVIEARKAYRAALSQQLTNARETQTALEAKNADLRQRLEDTEALLIIARATQTTMQDALTAKDAEIARLRAALESIINRNVMHDEHGAYLSPDNNEEEFQDIKRIAVEALGDE